MSIQIQEDCIGLVVNPTIVNPVSGNPIDLTTANIITFRFLSPTVGATTFEVAGAVDGDPTLGKVLYVNDSSEFFEAGTWKYQVKITFAGGQVVYTAPSKIKVKANI